MSKIPNDVLEQAVTDIVRYAKETKKRRFVETVELQVGLKNYDVAKDKRFSGTIRLPKVCKPRMKFCVLGDVLHCDEAAVLKVDSRDMDALNQFKRDKKLVKKLAEQYDAFLSSEAILRQIPRLLGPGLNKAGKFPTLITHNEPISQKITEVQSTIKFQMKKVLCVGVAVGHVDLTHDELVQNIQLAINFLISLLKKHWQNVRSVYIKTTMGPPQRLY